MPAQSDEFARNVYCVLGIPIDLVSMSEVVAQIFHAAESRERLFISTPNLNFVMMAQHNLAFRRSVLLSNLCTADGMGVLGLCRVLGIPIEKRVAGSDIPNSICAYREGRLGRPLRMAMFGGEAGVAQRAADAINNLGDSNLICVAAVDPGHMTEDKMRDPSIIQQINDSKPDFLLAALGAAKGQNWIVNNLPDLNVPVVSHLGATINFLAGTVKRAPKPVQKLGLEWLWRVKEEPKLAGRYWSDGTQTIKLLVSDLLPLGRWLRLHRKTMASFQISITKATKSNQPVTVHLHGNFNAAVVSQVKDVFRTVAKSSNDITLDLSGLIAFDMLAAGTILLLERHALLHHKTLLLQTGNREIARMFKHCGMAHLFGRLETTALA